MQVIDPVRSRCLCIRVAAPSQQDIMGMCQHVAGEEGLKLPEGLNARIAAASDRNLRRALLMLETCRAAKYPFSDDQPVQLTDWELYIQVSCLASAGSLIRCCGALTFILLVLE